MLLLEKKVEAADGTMPVADCSKLMYVWRVRPSFLNRDDSLSQHRFVV